MRSISRCLLAILLAMLVLIPHVEGIWAKSSEAQGIAIYLKGFQVDRVPKGARVFLRIAVDGKVKAVFGDVTKGHWQFEVEGNQVFSAQSTSFWSLKSGEKVVFTSEAEWRPYLLLFDPEAQSIQLEVLAARLPLGGLSQGASGVTGLEALSVDDAFKLGSLSVTFTAEGNARFDSDWMLGEGISAQFHVITGDEVKLRPELTVGLSGNTESVVQMFQNPQGEIYAHSAYKTWLPWDYLQPEPQVFYWDRLDGLKDLASIGFEVYMVSRLAGSKGDLISVKLPDWVVDEYLNGINTWAKLWSVPEAQIQAAVQAYGDFFYQLVIEAGKRNIKSVSPINEPNNPAQDSWPSKTSKIHPMIYDLLAEALIRGEEARTWLYNNGFFVPEVPINLNADTDDPRTGAALQDYRVFFQKLAQRLEGKTWSKRFLYINTYSGSWNPWPYYKGERIMRADPVWSADRAHQIVFPVKQAFDQRFNANVNYLISEIGWSTPDLCYAFQRRFVERLFERFSEIALYDPQFSGFLYFHSHDETPPEYGWEKNGVQSIINAVWAIEEQFGLITQPGQYKEAWQTFYDRIQNARSASRSASKQTCPYR